MKKIICLLLALVMVLGLAACGGGSKGTTVTMIAAQYGPKTADWWAEFEKKFEADNKGIDLVVDCVSWNDIYTVVNTRIANGQAPDLLNIDVFADYQADGLLLPPRLHSLHSSPLLRVAVPTTCRSKGIRNSPERAT